MKTKKLECITDQGVVRIYSDLTFKDHMLEKINKAYSVLGVIKCAAGIRTRYLRQVLPNDAVLVVGQHLGWFNLPKNFAIVSKFWNISAKLTHQYH